MYAELGFANWYWNLGHKAHYPAE